MGLQLLPRAKVVYGDLKKNLEKAIRLQELAEIKDTYELAILLFPEVYSRGLLEKYIEEAEKLKYPDGSEEKRKG